MNLEEKNQINVKNHFSFDIVNLFSLSPYQF